MSELESVFMSSSEGESSMDVASMTEMSLRVESGSSGLGDACLSMSTLIP